MKVSVTTESSIAAWRAFEVIVKLSLREFGIEYSSKTKLHTIWCKTSKVEADEMLDRLNRAISC